MARSNLDGAKRIVSTVVSESQRNSDPSMQFLMGWSAEGFLKTFLRSKEASEQELRFEIGHDLIEALDRAVARGLDCNGVGALRFVVEHLAPGHLNMHFRYLPTNEDGTDRGLTFVMSAVAIPALDALDAAVWPSVRGEFEELLAAMGRPPHGAWRAVLQPAG